MSTEATIQATVGPGDETGLYYITICNLPFGASWQQLKDWIRTACEVDRIEVFPKSTSAWVRVRGRENFEKAWGLLNGGVFNGRSIIASDRNRTESIKIKESVTSSQVSSSQTPRYYPTPPTQYGSPTSPDLSPQYSAASGGQYCLGNGYTTRVSTATYATQPSAALSYGRHASTTSATAIPASYATADGGDYYTYGDSTGAAAYSTHSQTSAAQYTLPYRSQTDVLSYYGNYGASQVAHSDYVVTEQRNLHVSPFPQQARADEVTSWLRRKVGSNKVISIEAPQNEGSRYLRGYAIIVFETSAGAINGMDLLNKARFQGRRVLSRLTSEGCTANESYDYEAMWSSGDSTIPETIAVAGPSRWRDAEGYGDNERGHRSKHSESKAKGTTDSDKRRSSDKKSSSSSKRNSQSEKKSSSSSSSKKRSSSDKKGSDPGPIVVDGSSRRRDKR